MDYFGSQLFGDEPSDCIHVISTASSEAKVVQTNDGLIPEKYLGLDRFVVREMIVADLKAAGCLVPQVMKSETAAKKLGIE